MKLSKSNILALTSVIILIFSLGFSGCDYDSEDPVTPKTLEQYYSEISAIVTSEKQVVQNCVLGYNKGDFRSGTYFEEYTTDYLNALIMAEEILAKSDLTITDCMDANYLISSPGKRFNDEVFPTDRRELDETVRYSDTLRVRTPIGSDPGMAPQEAHDQFGSAILVAKEVRTRMTAIDRQIAEANGNLLKETEIFEDEIVK